MGIKKQAQLILITFAVAGCVTAQGQLIKEERDFVKYAASVCIGSAFSNETVKSDANTAANVYMSNISLEAYEELRDLLKSWEVSGFMSKQGKRVEIVRCLEFSESQEVKQIFSHYNPCVNKTEWLDETEFKKQCEAR